MNPKLVRNLIVGNLAVYTVVAALLAYAYLFPSTPKTRAASNTVFTNNAPFISIMLPTPTPYSQALVPSSPAAIKTVVPFETPIPVTPVPRTATTPALQVAAVRDQGLVPPTNLNVILLGTDQRAGQSNWRTDTLILLTINQQEKTVGMLTIPRDLYVNIPGIGKQRINTADFYGYYYHYPGDGPNLIKQTIEQNLGIRVHYFVRGGFDAFRKAIDLLGGIQVDVDCPLYEQDFYDDYGHATLNFQPGLQTMDGVTALRYARSRYTTNDYDRGRRQRKVILAMWDKATALNLLPKWPELYEQMRDSIQTDLSPVEMAAFAYIGAQLKMNQIKSRAIDNRSTIPYITPEGAQVLLPNPEKIHAVLVEFFAPIADEVDAVATENARIQILSGNPQAAGIAATALKRQGLNTTAAAELVPLAASSTITLYKNKPATAQRLAALLRIDPASIQTATDGAAPFDIVVNLGRNYNACQK
ncbi:MAG: LCP family protein [Chloroflexi bacterium]|nr:LCP family protein [Chloroflexota bacterium]